MKAGADEGYLGGRGGPNGVLLGGSGGGVEEALAWTSALTEGVGEACEVDAAVDLVTTAFNWSNWSLLLARMMV